MKLIKYLKVLALTFGFLQSCQSSNSSDYNSSRPKTEAELKQELLNKECLNARSHVEGTLNYSPIYKNLLSGKVKGLKLSCKVKNNATLATLKTASAMRGTKSTRIK